MSVIIPTAAVQKISIRYRLLMYLIPTASDSWANSLTKILYNFEQFYLEYKIQAASITNLCRIRSSSQITGAELVPLQIGI